MLKSPLARVFLLALALAIGLTLLLLVFCRDSAKHFDGLSPEKDASIGQAAFNRFYFSCVALSTTGFGDISPRSTTARLFTSIAGLFVLTVLLCSARLHSTC